MITQFHYLLCHTLVHFLQRCVRESACASLGWLPRRTPRSFPAWKGHPGSDRFGHGCHCSAEKPPWQHPRAQQQLHLPESLWERDNWRQDQAGRGGASERGGGHIHLPPELDFRPLKCERLWGTVQDTAWHCTHSKIRDSKAQDCNVPISKIYGVSKETQDDRALVYPLLLSKGNKCNYYVPGVLETQSE